MKADIPIFSPPEARRKYLKDSKALDSKLRGDIALFSISKIEEIRPYLRLPNQPFRNTSHGFIFVLSGAVEINVDIMHQTLTANTLLLTPAGQATSILSIDSQTTGFFLTFHEHIFDNAQLASGLNTFSKLLDPDQTLLFRLQGDLLEAIHAICNRMLSLYHASEARLSQINHYVLAVLSELQTVAPVQTALLSESANRLVAQFKKALLEHITRNPKPADLAAVLHVSVNHLNKVLKSGTQRSTSQWIAKRQIMEAQLLLKHSTSSIAEVAHSLGFDDPSYFSKFFLRHAGVTPGQYRKAQVD